MDASLHSVAPKGAAIPLSDTTFFSPSGAPHRNRPRSHALYTVQDIFHSRYLSDPSADSISDGNSIPVLKHLKELNSARRAGCEAVTARSDVGQNPPRSTAQSSHPAAQPHLAFRGPDLK